VRRRLCGFCSVGSGGGTARAVQRPDCAAVTGGDPSARPEGKAGGHGRAGVDPYRDLPYWLVVLGDPTSTDPWAWRINGHHLLAQATVVGDQVNGVPHFFGAEPATVLEGPHAGLRALPREEDLARELMLALQEDQRRMARIAVKAPADIASRWDPVAALPEQPRGVRYARLDRLQRELFVSLLRQYVDRAASAIANQAWTDITDAGLGPPAVMAWKGGRSQHGHDLSDGDGAPLSKKIERILAVMSPHPRKKVAIRATDNGVRLRVQI
jgi:hypothetical protein